MEEFELEPGERIIRSVRKHWLVFLGQLLPFAFLAFVPTLIAPLLTFAIRNAPDTAALQVPLMIPEPWSHLIYGLWWLILWIGAFNVFTQYFLNVWVITTLRIVDIHQYGFFNRRVSSFLIVRVQDITTTVDTFLGDIFGFGTVRVETAGDDSKHFAMEGIHDPQAIRDLIMREISDLKGSST